MIDTIYFDFEEKKVTLITEDNEFSQSLRHPKDRSYKKTLLLLEKLLTDGEVSRTWIREVLGMKHRADVSHRLQFAKEILNSQESIIAGFFYIAESEDGYSELRKSRTFDIEIRGTKRYKNIINSSKKTYRSRFQKVAMELINFKADAFREEWLPFVEIDGKLLDADRALEKIKATTSRKNLHVYTLVGNAGSGKTGYCYHMISQYEKAIYIPLWELVNANTDLFTFIGDKYFSIRQGTSDDPYGRVDFKRDVVKSILNHDREGIIGASIVILDGFDEVSLSQQGKILEHIDDFLCFFDEDSDRQKLTIILTSRFSISNRYHIFEKTKTIISYIDLQGMSDEFFTSELREVLPYELRVPLFMTLTRGLSDEDKGSLKTLYDVLDMYLDHMVRQAAEHNVTKIWYTIYLPFLASKTIKSRSFFEFEIPRMSDELLDYNYIGVVKLYINNAYEVFGNAPAEIPTGLLNTGLLHTSSDKLMFSHLEIQRFLAARWRAMVWASNHFSDDFATEIGNIIDDTKNDFRIATYSTYLFMEIAEKIVYDTKNNVLTIGLSNRNIDSNEGRLLLELAGAVGVSAPTNNEAYRIYIAAKPLIVWFLQNKTKDGRLWADTLDNHDLNIISGINAILYQTHPVKLASNKDVFLNEIRICYENLIALFDKNTWVKEAKDKEDPDLLPRLWNNLGACRLQQIIDIPHERTEDENTAYSILTREDVSNPRNEAIYLRRSLKDALKYAEKDPDVVSLRRSWIAMATDWFWIGEKGIRREGDPYKKAIEYYEKALDEREKPVFEAEDFVIFLRMAGCKWRSSDEITAKQEAVIEYLYKGAVSLASYCFVKGANPYEINKRNVYKYKRHINQYWKGISIEYRALMEDYYKSDREKVRKIEDIVIMAYNEIYPGNHVCSFLDCVEQKEERSTYEIHSTFKRNGQK